MSETLCLGLGPQQFARAFPFHLAFDDGLSVVQVGPSLSKLYPELTPGCRLTEHLRLRGHPGALTYEELRAAINRLIIMETVRGQVPLRGQLLLSDSPSCLLFLCSPWVMEPASIHSMGLEISDFALHDPVVDLLQLVQSQNLALADMNRLADKLTTQRAELRSVNARLLAQYEVARVLAQGASLEEVAPPLLSTLRELGAWDLAVLWLLGDSPRAFMATRGTPMDSGSYTFEIYLNMTPPVPGVDPAGSAQRDATANWAEDLARVLSSGRARAAVKAGYHSACAFPLPGVNGVLGLCELYARESRRRDPYLLDALEEIGTRIGLFVDRSLAVQELRESKKAAETATLAKSQFLARMSHEIRTPINGTLGMLELVLGTSLTARQREHLEVAHSSAEMLLGLVNDVLDFSKIEAGQLQLAQSCFSLRETLERPLQGLAAKARSKGLRFTVKLPEHLPEFVQGDPLRLSQVLVNLLGNAVKFTHQGEVRLEVQAQERTPSTCVLGFAVRDTGVGIEPAKQRHIFDVFTQADAWTAQEYGGTGLGLAICQQLVQMMGGALSVESRPGEGSCFRFTAKLGLASPTCKPKQCESTYTLSQVRSPLRVLVVEDNQVNQVVARGLLEQMGHQVETVDRGDTAVARASGARFDVIFMDIQMPGMDGLEATRRIRQAEERSGAVRTPIVGLSAQAIVGDREKGLEAGMDEYLTKPVRGRQLAEALDRFVSQRRQGGLRKEAPPHVVELGPPVPEARSCMDRAALQELVGGDEELLSRIVSLFLQYGPGMRDDVLSALSGENAAALVAAAHKLKGALGELSARSIFAVCGRIESLARRGDLAAAREEREPFEREILQLFRELREFDRS